MHRVGTTQRVHARQLAGVGGYRGAELDRSRGRPVFLPGHLGALLTFDLQPVIAAGGGEGRTYLGVGQSTGNSSVSPIP